jgi:hypothetical protein
MDLKNISNYKYFCQLVFLYIKRYKIKTIVLVTLANKAFKDDSILNFL